MDVPSRPSPDVSEADGARSAPGPVGPSSKEEQLTRVTAPARTRTDKRGKRFTAALRVEGGSSCDVTAARICSGRGPPAPTCIAAGGGGAVDAGLHPAHRVIGKPYTRSCQVPAETSVPCAGCDLLIVTLGNKELA